VMNWVLEIQLVAKLQFDEIVRADRRPRRQNEMAGVDEPADWQSRPPAYTTAALRALSSPWELYPSGSTIVPQQLSVSITGHTEKTIFHAERSVQ